MFWGVFPTDPSTTCQVGQSSRKMMCSSYENLNNHPSYSCFKTMSELIQYKFMKLCVWSSKSWQLLTLKIFFWLGQIFAWVSPNEWKLSSTGKSPAPLTGPAHSTSWVCFQPSNMSHRAETQSGEMEAKGRSLSRAPLVSGPSLKKKKRKEGWGSVDYQILNWLCISCVVYLYVFFFISFT